MISRHLREKYKNIISRLVQDKCRKQVRATETEETVNDLNITMEISD
jgi:hypothetical protein